MEKKKAFGLIIGTVVVFFVLSYFFMNGAEESYETEKIDMSLVVGNYTGIKADTDAVYFGTIAPGSSSKRFVMVENIHDTDIEVAVNLEGGLAEWVRVSEERFVLGPGENKTIEVVAQAPITAIYGNRSGELVLDFFRK